MRDKTDSLSVVETVKPSAHFDLPAFWSVLSHLTWFQKLLMLASDSSPACITFLPFTFISLHTELLLSSTLVVPPARRAHRYRRHHHKTRRERRKHKRHSHREGGHHGREGGQGHNHARFWTKKNHHPPPPFSPLLPAAVCLSPCRPHFPKQFFTITAQNSLTKPPPSGLVPHCIVLPLALQVSLYHSQLHQQDNNKSLCTLFTFLSRSDVLVIPLLSLTYLLSWPTYSPLELNDDLKHGATLTCF